MHVLGSQNEVLRFSHIDMSNTEPPLEDTVDEQLYGGQTDDDVHVSCSPTTMYSRRKQIHQHKRGT